MIAHTNEEKKRVIIDLKRYLADNNCFYNIEKLNDNKFNEVIHKFTKEGILDNKEVIYITKWRNKKLEMITTDISQEQLKTELYYCHNILNNILIIVDKVTSDEVEVIDGIIPDECISLISDSLIYIETNLDSLKYHKHTIASKCVDIAKLPQLKMKFRLFDFLLSNLLPAITKIIAVIYTYKDKSDLSIPEARGLNEMYREVLANSILILEDILQRRY